jgi:hypothetical protein
MTISDKYGASCDVSAEQLMATGAGSLPCLWEQVLEQTGIAALVGSSDTGKSSFLRDSALVMSLADPTKVGGKRRYRMSDVKAILEGGRRRK